jgi:hypothetical protein
MGESPGEKDQDQDQEALGPHQRSLQPLLHLQCPQRLIALEALFSPGSSSSPLPPNWDGRFLAWLEYAYDAVESD